MSKYYHSIWDSEYDEYDEYGCSYDYVGIDGKPVERTKDDYPYSYDSYVVWEKDYDKSKSSVVYSDRLWQWDYNKFNECCMKVWGNKGQMFYENDRTPEEIEKFLIKYFGKKVKLTVIMQGCNVANGYPIWIFFYEDKTE